MPWWSRETLFGCFQKIGVFTPPKWLVKVMENPIKMDGLGGPPLFSETSILTKNTKWFAEMSFPSQLVTCHIFVHPLSRQELENFSLEPSLKIYNSFIAACGRTKKWLHAVNVLATLRSLGGEGIPARKYWQFVSLAWKLMLQKSEKPGEFGRVFPIIYRVW